MGSREVWRRTAAVVAVSALMLLGAAPSTAQSGCPDGEVDVSLLPDGMSIDDLRVFPGGHREVERLCVSVLALPLDTWEGEAEARAIDLRIELPPVVTGALATLGVDDVVPGVISDRIVTSRAVADWRRGTAGDIRGSSLGELFDPSGTLGSLVDGLVGLPRAEAALGEQKDDNLLRIDSSGLRVGVGEVAAGSAQDGDREITSAGSSSIVDLEITLGELLAIAPDAARVLVNDAVDQLLEALYGGENGTDMAVVPLLQGALDDVLDTLSSAGVDLAEVTGLDFTIPRITRQQLIDRPLVKVGLIQTASEVTDGTGELAGYKVSSAEAIIKDVSLLGGLVEIEVLHSKAAVAANGKTGGVRQLPPTQTVAGLTVGTNRIDIGDFTTLDGIRINDQRINLASVVGEDLANTVDGLYQTLMQDVLGIVLEIPDPDRPPVTDQQIANVEQQISLAITTVESQFAREGWPAVTNVERHFIGAKLRAEIPETLRRQAARQNVTALLVDIWPLRNPVLGQNLGAAAAALPRIQVGFSQAGAAVANDPLNVQSTAGTGLPTTPMAAAGAGLLLAAAFLGRRLLGFAR